MNVLKVEFHSLKDLSTKLTALLQEIGAGDGSLDAARAATPGAAPAEAPKRGPGRPPKNPEHAHAEPTNVLTAQESMSRASMSVDDLDAAPVATAAKVLSLDDVRADLQQVITLKGPDHARAILKQFGALKISELKPETYQEAINACRKVISQK